MKNSQRLDKDLERMKILNVVIAANYYDMAYTFSCFTKRSSTIAGAQEVAKIIESFNGKNISEFLRVKLTEDYAENAIKAFETYKDAVKIYQFDETILESFCEWFSHAGGKFNEWKLNAKYIIGIGLAIIGYSLGKITNDEKDDRIGTITSPSPGICFSYRPSSVLRSFAEISAKYKEVETKVMNRSKNVIQ